MVLGELDSYMQKNETQSPTYTIHKKNSRWIKDFNVSYNTIKVLEENISRTISNIPHSNIFTDMSPRARDIKGRINKWDFIKIESFWMAKENISKMNREQTVWENIFANDNSKNSQDSSPGRQTTQLKNGQRT